jgi:hypothetical protein
MDGDTRRDRGGGVADTLLQLGLVRWFGPKNHQRTVCRVWALKLSG